MLAIPWAAALINPRRFHDSLIARLWNFGAYARRDPCRPDDSCVNPIWAQWIPSKAWEEAWGEQVSADPGDELEVDEQDAEAIEAWLLQLAQAHRAIILRRFVLRCRIPVLEVNEAVRALADLIEQNWATVANVRQLQRK